MRIEICKGRGLMSKWGALSEGMRATIPDHVADNWIKQGIAFPIDGEGHPLTPVDIPNGSFWCMKHATLHRLDSRQGEKCQKRQVNEADEAEKVRIAAEAEVAREKAEALAPLDESGDSDEDPDKEPEGESKEDPDDEEPNEEPDEE